MVSAFAEPADESSPVTFAKVGDSDDGGDVEMTPTSPVNEDTKSDNDQVEANGDDKDAEAVDEDEDGPEEEEDDVYVVERIVSHRRNRKSKSFEYKVRWEGYGSDDDTWEPHENIADSASLAVDTYWEPLGGFEKNKDEQAIGVAKRKRQSTSADVQPASTVPAKRRRQTGSVSGTPAKVEEVVPDVPAKAPTATKATRGSGTSDWKPPLELKSWDSHADVDTLEKDEKNELYILLYWRKENQKSRHKAEVVYKKMPMTMLRFYEANLVFKPVK